MHGIKKSTKNYRVEKSNQTGFASPATHYGEPRIDLNEELVEDSSSTFFIRIGNDDFHELGINSQDVLIVNKARSPKTSQLILAVVDGNFKVVQLAEMMDETLEVWGVVTYIIKTVL